MSRVALLIAIASFGTACATVQPWQRARLADPCMTFEANAALTAYASHWQESREGSSGGAGVLGFYEPAINCHTTVYSSAFWSDRLTKNGGNITSLQTAFDGWLDAIVSGAPQNRAWIQDALSTDPVTWSNGIYGGGWTTNVGMCQP